MAPEAVTDDLRLTRGEINHLDFALTAIRRSGSYYGSRSQFLKRQLRLEQWLTRMRPKPRAVPMKPEHAAIYHGDIDVDFNY
jgi:hypothetical protein